MKCYPHLLPAAARLISDQASNSHFEKIFFCVIVQHFENICKGSHRLFLLRCNQYFFHRSLNAPTPVELCLSKAGKAIASSAAPFWGCPVMNCKAKPPSQWNDVSMLQLKRKRLRLPDGLLTKVYKNIVNGYHNENC